MSGTDLIDKVETARLIGGESSAVSIGFVNQLLAARILPKVRISYKVCRIPRAAVEEFIRKRTVNARGDA
jgi:hypothetical protein